MERIIKFFDRKIVEMVSILIGIYIILYLLKIDVYLITTVILFALYFYYRYTEREKEKDIILNRKKEPFKNEIPSIINKYDDIINFLYFISDFKQYNEQVYDQFVINLNDFFTLYEDYQVIPDNKKKLMDDVIFDTKNKILYDLSSFIYSFNNNPILRKKLEKSVDMLNNILNEYINSLNIKINSIEGFNNY
jgi:Ca2+/Na+ antiporter